MSIKKILCIIKSVNLSRFSKENWIKMWLPSLKLGTRRPEYWVGSQIRRYWPIDPISADGHNIKIRPCHRHKYCEVKEIYLKLQKQKEAKSKIRTRWWRKRHINIKNMRTVWDWYVSESIVWKGFNIWVSWFILLIIGRHVQQETDKHLVFCTDSSEFTGNRRQRFV